MPLVYIIFTSTESKAQTKKQSCAYIRLNYNSISFKKFITLVYDRRSDRNSHPNRFVILVCGVCF